MNYYEQAIPPVRDQRLVIGDTFEGSVCQLLDCAKSGCLLQKNRRFMQANMCQMTLSLMMATTVENCVIVMHAPIGCGSALYPLALSSNKGKALRGKAPVPPVWLSTNLRESDVIGGGEQKLRETIIYADREFRPEIIFVVSTCAPNIIGDDVEEIVRSTDKGTSAHVTAIYCPGFKSCVVASAYDAFYHSLLRHVPLEPIPYRDYTPVEHDDPDYAAKLRSFNNQKKMTVNLFNATSMGPDDEEEMTRLLNALGLNVRIFAEYCNADELRMMSHAGLNVSMCNVHDDYLLTYLQEKYDIPCIICGMPVGFASTRAWLMEIAAHYNLEDKAKSVIEDEERQLKDALEPLLPQVAGKRALVVAGVIRTSAEALLLKELGLEVIGITAYHYDNGADSVINDVSETFPDVPLAVSNQPFETLNHINRAKPDIVISHNMTHGWLARAGAVSMQVFDTDKPFFGYTGIYRFIRRIIFAFKNTSYSDRLAQKVRQPYAPGWYEKDANHYMVGN
jgi:nitrogenase molybdenum-iron protein alpha chain